MDDGELVRALKALADPVRFRMVRELAAAGELSCGEVQTHFRLSQPTISHHLKILSEAGIVAVRAEAKHHYFSVDRALLRALVGLIPARLGAEAARAGQRAKSKRAVARG